jgi:nucleotide-binding universal stress UspA family protein
MEVGKMLEKVLVCLDGSTPAERILPYITRETAAQHGKMILLTVIDLPETVLPFNIPGSPAVTVSTPGAVKRTFTEENTANDYLKGQEKSLEAQGLDVDYIVISGSPGETIVSYAQENECTLIAIATHGHGGFRRFALGSTADYVVHHSSIPVLTVRR